MEKPYIVYKHISPTEKIYIGITCQTPKKRFMNGRGYKQCPAMALAIKKHGWNSFKTEVLFEGLSKEEAEAKEIELIAKYKSNQKDFGYNIENGGNVIGTHSEETKRKISAGNKGRTFSEESIQKMREAHKGQGIGEANPFYGRHHTKETKEAHSKFMQGNDYFKGKHHSEEFKKVKSKQMSEKYSNGGNPHCKKVECLDEKEEVVLTFFSLREASRHFKRSTSTIYKYIHTNGIYEGYKWRYSK